MALPFPRPSICQHRVTRFLASGKKKKNNNLDKWRIDNQTRKNDSCALRFTHLNSPHDHTCNRLLSIRHRLLPPLFHRLSTPRHPLFLMMVNSDASPKPSTAKTVRVVVKGRVQGVFYRNWTVENANQLGLKGWVRNRRDGSVEALFSGKSDSVQEMEQRCRRGPPAALVTGFEVYPSSDDPGNGFERKPTA
ncbi:hypothetical protein UlMin_005811 [Ulmus minor]